MHCHERRRDGAATTARTCSYFGYTVGEVLPERGRATGAADSWNDFEAVHDDLPDLGDSPTSAIGTPARSVVHLRRAAARRRRPGAPDAPGRPAVAHEANCRSLEKFAARSCPSSSRVDERDAVKAERLAPRSKLRSPARSACRQVGGRPRGRRVQVTSVTCRPAEDFAIERGSSEATSSSTRDARSRSRRNRRVRSGRTPGRSRGRRARGRSRRRVPIVTRTPTSANERFTTPWRSPWKASSTAVSGTSSHRKFACEGTTGIPRATNASYMRSRSATTTATRARISASAPSDASAAACATAFTSNGTCSLRSASITSGCAIA